ncbi:hypothetical protein LCGC14_3160210, partial [marine sediment metagenome]
FIVATGAGAFQYEAATVVRTSLGLGTGDSPTFVNGTFTGGMVINRTSVTSSPYNVLVTDFHISITTASVAITLNLPAIVDGTIYHFKDQDENAA